MLTAAMMRMVVLDWVLGENSRREIREKWSSVSGDYTDTAI
jgi:hypothetical protein